MAASRRRPAPQQQQQARNQEAAAHARESPAAGAADEEERGASHTGQDDSLASGRGTKVGSVRRLWRRAAASCKGLAAKARRYLVVRVDPEPVPAPAAEVLVTLREPVGARTELAGLTTEDDAGAVAARYLQMRGLSPDLKRVHLFMAGVEDRLGDWELLGDLLGAEAAPTGRVAPGGGLCGEEAPSTAGCAGEEERRVVRTAQPEAVAAAIGARGTGTREAVAAGSAGGRVGAHRLPLFAIVTDRVNFEAPWLAAARKAAEHCFAARDDACVPLADGGARHRMVAFDAHAAELAFVMVLFPVRASAAAAAAAAKSGALTATLGMVGNRCVLQGHGAARGPMGRALFYRESGMQRPKLMLVHVSEGDRQHWWMPYDFEDGEERFMDPPEGPCGRQGGDDTGGSGAGGGAEGAEKRAGQQDPSQRYPAGALQQLAGRRGGANAFRLLPLLEMAGGATGTRSSLCALSCRHPGGVTAETDRTLKELQWRLRKEEEIVKGAGDDDEALRMAQISKAVLDKTKTALEEHRELIRVAAAGEENAVTLAEASAHFDLARRAGGGGVHFRSQSELLGAARVEQGAELKAVAEGLLTMAAAEEGQVHWVDLWARGDFT